ncbi:AAA family ATPase [Mucilaginibacter sp. ZT4R22]|uniref:AAA family ATPase n=1 Tax=Mucilaginibacter pankratovii TaxID=2772110 RepID=A0ABR7WS58_9SPHI|nr:AAA family ATPase [Mucilaginibacter pankratovii]MBD1365143.1 AAA family ATPase [Mucilaginibacter pankratovii]
MEKQSLHFTSLHVRKMPGFPDGLKPITGLSRHVNIIAGPNASGKTSTATAIHQLLWPPTSGRMNLEGAIETGNNNWDVRLDYGQFRAQRNGITGELPGIPASDESVRYNFSLQELVHINDKDLAGKIYQEAMGGYNLGNAAAALKYSSDIKKKNSGAYTGVTAADAQVAEINGKQQDLKDKENSLSVWIAARDKAAEASKLKEFYQAMVNCLEARELKESHELKLSAYPQQLRVMFGNEYEEIIALEDRMEALRIGLETNREAIQKHKDAISELGLSEKGISPPVLKELEDRVEALIEAERTISELGIAIADLTGTMEALKLQIHPDYEPGEEIKMDLSKIAKLDEFIDGAHRLLSQMKFIQIQIDSLSKKSAPVNQNAGQIKEGIKSLTNWLGEQKGTDGTKIYWLWLLVAGACAVALAVALWGWWGMAGVIILIAFALLGQGKKADGKADVRREDFRKTGLKEPTDWQPENVRTVFEELCLQLQAAELYALEKQEVNRLTVELESLQPELQKTEAQRDDWIRFLGHAPALPSDDLKNYSAFFWYISQLSKYAEFAVELKGKRGREKAAANQRDAELKKINGLLNHFGLAVEDGIVAKATVKHLLEKENARKNTVTTIDGLIELGDEKGKQLKEAGLKLEGIYKRLGLETPDKHEVYRLVDQLDDYKKAEAGCQEKKILYVEMERLQQNHETYASYKDKLPDMDLATAQRSVSDFASVAAEFDGLNDKIISTNALIQREKSGHDLEDALAKKEAALDNLQQVYDDNLSALTGSLLISHLEKEGGERNSSNVLKRGNQLFNKITSGRYELRINNMAQLDFLAYDHILHEGQSLNQLSTGTRIQLLLSIRLAYIESQEKEFQIPIIADELLANSDDQRASQIIEALAEIAMEGRQVFYFTAQKEEIAKWKSYADEHVGFEIKIYVLESDASEKSDYLGANDEPFSLNLFEKIPAIAGQTHDSYRKLIAIPGFQLMAQDPAQLHLWYLLDDLSDLATCLENRITTYGQLTSYIKNGGIIPGFDQDRLQQLEKKIRLLEAFQELYQKGRPKVIDLNVLKGSNAVTERYLQEVYEVLKAVVYNPEELIRELGQNAVSGFRSNSKEKLETYLVDEGYISEEPLLAGDELAQLVQIKVRKLGLDPAEGERFLELVTNN